METDEGKERVRHEVEQEFVRMEAELAARQPGVLDLLRVYGDYEAALRHAVHPDKTFIGRVERGFDFLGSHLTPQGLSVAPATRQRFCDRAHRLAVLPFGNVPQAAVEGPRIEIVWGLGQLAGHPAREPDGKLDSSPLRADQPGRTKFAPRAAGAVASSAATRETSACQT